MNDGLIPRRYAKALLKVAIERHDDKRIYQLSNTLYDSFASCPALQNTLSNPFIASDKKIELLMTASGASASDSTFSDFLQLLKKNERLDLARDIARSYCDDYRKANNIYRVTVTAAAKMAEAEENRLKQLIVSHLNGGTMEYTFKVDPELIGGFTVTIDSEKLDTSVKNQLEQLRLKLLG
ncbi:MAG: ATP synthase F1 subunit delta [Bacteroidales bacterium]|nr:ATP synthase F1 subunit delta [Bacteroidales bacterium]